MSRNPKELTKAEVVARAEALDARRQDQIARQIDSINRLLEVQDLPPERRYEGEMLALNNAIIDLDKQLMLYRSTTRRIKQSLTDKLSHTEMGDAYLSGLLDVIHEVDPAVPSGNGSTPVSD